MPNTDSQDRYKQARADLRKAEAEANNVETRLDIAENLETLEKTYQNITDANNDWLSAESALMNFEQPWFMNLFSNKKERLEAKSQEAGRTLKKCQHDLNSTKERISEIKANLTEAKADVLFAKQKVRKESNNIFQEARDQKNSFLNEKLNPEKPVTSQTTASNLLPVFLLGGAMLVTLFSYVSASTYLTEENPHTTDFTVAP